MKSKGYAVITRAYKSDIVCAFFHVDAYTSDKDARTEAEEYAAQEAKEQKGQTFSVVKLCSEHYEKRS